MMDDYIDTLKSRLSWDIEDAYRIAKMNLTKILDDRKAEKLEVEKKHCLEYIKKKSHICGYGNPWLDKSSSWRSFYRDIMKSIIDGNEGALSLAGFTQHPQFSDLSLSNKIQLMDNYLSDQDDKYLQNIHIIIMSKSVYPSTSVRV
jgi:hypothetical protein